MFLKSYLFSTNKDEVLKIPFNTIKIFFLNLKNYFIQNKTYNFYYVLLLRELSSIIPFTDFYVLRYQ